MYTDDPKYCAISSNFFLGSAASLHCAGSSVLIPIVTGVNALSFFVIVYPGLLGSSVACTSVWSSLGSTESSGIILGDDTSFVSMATHVSFPRPLLMSSQLCPSDLHLYSLHGFIGSLHFSHSSPPGGACHGRH